MKNKFYTSFWTLLFVGIILFGVVSTGTNCPDMTNRICSQTNDLFVGANTSFLPRKHGTYDEKFPCSATNNWDFCCTKRPCNSKAAPFLNTHFQNLDVTLIVTAQKPQDRDTLPAPAPDPLNAIPTVLIYILTQSFLC
jgi:hypothetical protein